MTASILPFVLAAYFTPIANPTAVDAPTSKSTAFVSPVENSTPTVIHVGLPTGRPATDRAKIKAAIAQAQPGDVIQFATGTYVIGFEQPSQAIEVPVADVTLVGSPQGTTIFGGEVTEFKPQDGFLFNQGGATVRRLRFVSFFRALLIGPGRPDLGGNTIENNVFENLYVGAFMDLQSPDVTLIARNEYINVALAYDLAGGILHFVGNTNRAPNPAAVPLVAQPLNAGFVLGFPELECNDNVIENNTVDGNSDGFVFVTFGVACRRNVVRNNSFTNQTVFTELDTGTLAFFENLGGELANNVIEGNSLDGTRGYGILASGLINSHFVANTLLDVRRRSDLAPPLLPGGVAILFLGESRGNAISSNRLNGEFCDVWLRRHTLNNVVVEPNDTVLDRGRRNQILSAGSCGMDAEAVEAEGAEEHAAASEKVRTLLRLRGR